MLCDRPERLGVLFFRTLGLQALLPTMCPCCLWWRGLVTGAALTGALVACFQLVR
jgi:hypothetical protein